MRYFIKLLCLIFIAIPIFSGLTVLILEAFNLAEWLNFFTQEGIFISIGLSFWLAFASTLFSLFLAALVFAYTYQSAFFIRLQKSLPTLLALPHVAFVIGFAFILAPSGWIIRIISPSLTGFDSPPDWRILKDSYALALLLCLVLKETLFILFMAIAALEVKETNQLLWLGQSMGFSSSQIFWRLIFPKLWRAIRLPIYTVAAYGISVVDLSLLIAPTNPAPLAVRLWLWMQAPSPEQHILASKAAITLGILSIITISILYACEKFYSNGLKFYWLNGLRRSHGDYLSYFASIFVKNWIRLTFIINAGVILSLIVWSFTRRWSFPKVLPEQWSLVYWQSSFDNLINPVITSMSLAILSAFIGLILVILSLEAQVNRWHWPAWLICLPLLLPQASLLQGIYLSTSYLLLKPNFWLVLWCHLLFVYPYMYLCLYGAYRQFNQNFINLSYTLGLSPWLAWIKVKAPMLIKPILFSFIIGASVSLSQYLPTLLFGAGRIITITTEAISIGSGLDRRTASVYGLLQLTLPFILYILIIFLPKETKSIKVKN